MPRKLRRLIADLEAAGFRIVPGGKGSNRKFRHARFAGSVILSGKEGDDALPYQEKHVRNAIRESAK
jgi:predicted RNA binding protein YcfA (HicA-like mRNA interferase family)